MKNVPVVKERESQEAQMERHRQVKTADEDLTRPDWGKAVGMAEEYTQFWQNCVQILEQIQSM